MCEFYNRVCTSNVQYFKDFEAHSHRDESPTLPRLIHRPASTLWHKFYIFLPCWRHVQILFLTLRCKVAPLVGLLLWPGVVFKLWFSSWCIYRKINECDCPCHLLTLRVSPAKTPMHRISYSQLYIYMCVFVCVFVHVWKCAVHMRRWLWEWHPLP